jgi:hypothetical protein
MTGKIPLSQINHARIIHFQELRSSLPSAHCWDRSPSGRQTYFVFPTSLLQKYSPTCCGQKKKPKLQISRSRRDNPSVHPSNKKKMAPMRRRSPRDHLDFRRDTNRRFHLLVLDTFFRTNHIFCRTKNTPSSVKNTRSKLEIR